jgi:hypothetical protein
MLYSEWLVTEQNTLSNRAQRRRGPATWPYLDFGRRVLTKGLPPSQASCVPGGWGKLREFAAPGGW